MAVLHKFSKSLTVLSHIFKAEDDDGNVDDEDEEEVKKLVSWFGWL